MKVVTLRPISPDDLDKEVEAVFKRSPVSSPNLWSVSSQNSTPVSQFGATPGLFNEEDVFGAFTADEWPLEHEKDAGKTSPRWLKVVTLRPISPDDLDKEVEAVFKRSPVSSPKLWIGSFQSTPFSQFGATPGPFSEEDVFGAFTADEWDGDQSVDFKTTAIYKKPCSPEVFNWRSELPNEHNAYIRPVPHHGNEYSPSTIQAHVPAFTAAVPLGQPDENHASFRPIQSNSNAQSHATIQAPVRPIPVLGQPGGNTLRVGGPNNNHASFRPNNNHASFRPIQPDSNAHASIIPAYVLAHPKPVRQEPPQADQAKTKASLEEALLKATPEPNMNDAPCNSEKAESNNLVNT